MKNTQKILAVAVLLFLFIISAGCSYQKTSFSGSFENIFQINRQLGRGINLGNALDAPHEGEWGVVLQAQYFEIIADAGFQTVRIPIRWPAHTGGAPSYTIDTAFFNRVDWVVRQTLSNKLYAIINIHHYDAFDNDPAGQKEKFLKLWEQIATHYRNYSDSLLFEVLNEPHSVFNDQPLLWNESLAAAMHIIRESNPTRVVIAGPVHWNNISYLDKLTLPGNDTNMIVTIHYYEPFHFTHQGAGWVQGSDAWMGTTWEGTETEKKAIKDDFEKAATWARAHHVPLFLGEFGAYSKADMDSRSRWTSFVARTAESMNMSWAYWEFCSGFGAYNPDIGQWRQQLREALIPSK